MKAQKKPFKFYFYIFLFSVIIVAAYSFYMIFAKDAAVSDVYTLWFMPFIFTAFYYGSDALIDKLANRKKSKVNNEAKFLEEVSLRMRESNEFLVEEFRKLQMNGKFQEDLKKAFYIYNTGDNAVFSMERLEKKYRIDTVEFRAMKYVLEYLEESKKMPESD